MSHILLTVSLVSPDDKNNLAIQVVCADGHVDVVRLLLKDGRVNPSVKNLIRNHIVA